LGFVILCEQPGPVQHGKTGAKTKKQNNTIMVYCFACFDGAQTPF